MRTVGAIAGVSLRRVLHDRTFLFFLVVLPTLIILLIGITIRQSKVPVGVADVDGSAASRQVVDDLRASRSVDVRNYGERDDLRRAMQRGEVIAGVVVPAGYEERLRAFEPAEVELLADTSSEAVLTVRSRVGAVVAAHNRVAQAAQFTMRITGSDDFDASAARAEALATVTPRADVATTTIDASHALPEGFGYTAPSNLVLFVFINSMAAGGAIIELRRTGVAARILAAPVSGRALLAGEMATYFVLAAFQGALIFGLGAVAFGVDWGSLPGALTVVVVWALVGTGAGMVVGSVLRTPEQATSIGPIVGIALGMLGGCMWPLEIVSPLMRRIGHATPHAWAMDAFVDLIARGASLRDVLPQLAVLLAFAAGFLTVGVAGLRRSIAR